MDETIQAILIAFFSGNACAAVITGVFAMIAKKGEKKAKLSKEEEQVQLGIREGVKELLKDRIKTLGNEYIARGHVKSSDLNDLITMHKIYHDDLCGNGFLNKIMEDVMNLPIKN